MNSARSYPIDSQSKSQDLASTILAASAPSTISAAIAAVENFLHQHPADHSRWFFSITFPVLIARIFGFDDSAAPKPQPPNGWIDIVTAINDADLTSRIFDFLSPRGVLISAIFSIDRHSLVKYVFPVERLPEWVKFFLRSDRDCRILSDLCPLFKGRVKEDPIKGSFQVQLNVFEYYMFWFAYYPVCRGNSEGSDGPVAVRKSRKFRFENWAYSFPVFSSIRRGSEQKSEGNLYMQLLYAYLHVFLPFCDLHVNQPYRSSLLHCPSGYDASVLLQAEFFMCTLIQFWLVDNDFSPLPMTMCKSFGLSFPFRSVLGETPPTPGLGEIVKLLVNYLNVSFKLGTDFYETSGYKGSAAPRAPNLVDVPIGSWNSLIRRPLYRFILRTFLLCPLDSSLKNTYQVCSLWVSYMEPWMSSLEEYSVIDAIIEKPNTNMRKEETQPPVQRYSSSWQGYVLANYLFYSSMVMHFIGFAHKFLHTDPELIVQMVLKVVNLLTSSRELVDLMKDIDTVFHSKPAGSSKSMLNTLYQYVPALREQLEDWEDGLCESDADGSFLHENWNKDLRLFNDSEDGGQRLLQLFILRAESELQALSGDNLVNSLQYLDSMKTQASFLFGEHILHPILATPEARKSYQSRDEIFKPRRVDNEPRADIKYKGDWMKRPISDDEVAWLAKLLVRLSDWINDSLGLNQVESSSEVPSCPPYVKVPSEVIGYVSGPIETMKVVFSSIASWLLVLGSAMLRFMRRHGLRVNLRVLASKKVMMVFLLYIVFTVLKKAFGYLLFGVDGRV